MSSQGIIQALRECATWDEIAKRLGLPVETARQHIYDLFRARVPADLPTISAPGLSAALVRDEWGIPTVTAGSEPEAYFGLGFAMGQDRLWQMEYFRRAAYGTLSEVLGPAALDVDRLARTLDFRRIAGQGAAQLPADTRALLDAFCAGVNLARRQALRDGLPLEFEILGIEPGPWEAADSLAVLRAFWWQLTGRFAVICLPEFVRRSLGDTPLFEALLRPEGGRETIWPRGVPHPDLPHWDSAGGDESCVTDGAAPGSNNWVVGPSRAAAGAPMLASDPHVPIAIPSVWYEARLNGGNLELAGAHYVGVPGVFFGRNRQVAWGLTNNISSLRDLYLETTDDFDPSRYRRPEGWQGVRSRTETIPVRGSAPVTLEVREVDHGPIVSDLLPPFARTGEIVSLRWVGLEPTDELSVMARYARATTVSEFREQLRGWCCPTFNFVAGDQAGQIGYQLTGRLPLRPVTECGYRSGDEAGHRWAGYIPFEHLPASGEPPEGWLGSANNIVAVDWPYPLTGTWPSDYRMQRLVQALNAPPPLTAQDMRALQYDSLSPRAVEWALPAVAALRAAGVDDPLLAEIEAWDRRYTRECRAAVVFESFFVAWARGVLTHRFPASLVSFLFPAAIGLVERLLVEDAVGWFAGAADRTDALQTAWAEALAWLEEHLGVDRTAWRWEQAHVLMLRHPLGATPVLRELFERGPVSHAGTWNTINNSIYEPDRPFETTSGVSYRLLVDFAGRTEAVVPGGQSGHPGSPHYDDQLPLWQNGEYRGLELS
ncbi:MAG: penicillin acylase family protein [Actinomycetota bacterium]